MEIFQKEDTANQYELNTDIRVPKSLVSGPRKALHKTEKIGLTLTSYKTQLRNMDMVHGAVCTSFGT
jgi:hypothetical protein